ncbi:MAG: hypothetical protein EON93_14360 [Burkholderiales bacterium]|nr:MAG: hypothetical protein EON93_14360 [Burkholderiales bacterium]
MDQRPRGICASILSRNFSPRTTSVIGVSTTPKQIELVRITETSERWVIRQIRTGDELAEEGARMHHCVYSYKGSCMSGHSSIWTMRRNNKRMLTIEMNNQADIVQIRGFGNRLATPEEMKMINQWAREAGVTVRRSGY